MARYRNAIAGHDEATVHDLILERGVVVNPKTKKRLGTIKLIKQGVGKDNVPTGVLEAKPSWKFGTIPLEKLLEDYEVQIEGVKVGEQKGRIKPEGPSAVDEFAEAARKHFKIAKAKAVRLPADVFSEKAIEAMVRAGFAEYMQKKEFKPGQPTATMDRAEFQRWAAHRRGVAIPSTGRPPSPEKVETEETPEDRARKTAELIRTRGEREPSGKTAPVPLPIKMIGNKLVDIISPESKERAEAARHQEAENRERTRLGLIEGEEQTEAETGTAGHKGRFEFRRVIEDKQPPVLPPRASKEGTFPAKRAASGWKIRPRERQKQVEEAVAVELRTGSSEPDRTIGPVKAIVGHDRYGDPVYRQITREEAERFAAQATKGWKGRKATPNRLMDDLNKAIDAAEAAFKAFVKNESAATAAAADAADYAAWQAWDKAKVRRVGRATGIKLATAIRNEKLNKVGLPIATLRAAHAEQELFDKGQKAGRDPHLLKIAELHQKYLDLGKKAIYEKDRARYIKQIMEVQDRRIAAAEKVDARMARERAAMDADIEAERQMLVELEQRLVDKGIIKESTITSQGPARAAEIGKYTKLLRRKAKSGPKLRKLIATTKLPNVGSKTDVQTEAEIEAEDKTPAMIGTLASGEPVAVMPHRPGYKTARFVPLSETPDQAKAREKRADRAKFKNARARKAVEDAKQAVLDARLAGHSPQRMAALNKALDKAERAAAREPVENDTYKRIAEWARDFVRQAEQAARGRGAYMPTKISTRFNTLEENAVIFVRKMLVKRGERKMKRELLEGGGELGRGLVRLKEGEAPELTQAQKDEIAEFEAAVRRGEPPLLMPGDPAYEAMWPKSEKATPTKEFKRKPRKGMEPSEIADPKQQKAYNLMEAYTVMYLMQRRQQALNVGTDEAKAAAQADQDIVEGMILEEAVTASTATRGQGMGQKWSQKAYEQQRGMMGENAPEDIESYGEQPTETEAEQVAAETTDEGESADEMAERLIQSGWAHRTRKRDDEYSAMPEGWDFVDTSPEDMDNNTRLAAEDIVRQVAGLSGVHWIDRLKIGRYMPAWGKHVEDAAGSYTPGLDAITLVRSMGVRGTAFHEAFHRLQNLFLTDKQHAVLAAENERLRKIVAGLEGREGSAAGMSQREIQAEAFRAHAMGLVKLTGRVAVIWSKLKQLYRRTSNMLAGRGFQTAEDIFAKAAAGEVKNQPQRAVPYSIEHEDYMAAPFSTQSLAQASARHWQTLEKKVNRGKLLLKPIDNETMRRWVAEGFFGGSYDNPFSRYLDAHLSHERRVEDAMRRGDKLDGLIRNWEAQDRRRTKQLQDAYETLLEGSIDNVDPRKPLPASADAAKQAMHARLSAEWAKAPAELQKLLSDRADHMKKQMELYERTWARHWLQELINKKVGGVKLPNFLTFDRAIDQLMTGQLSPGFAAELGKNAETLTAAKDIGKYNRRSSLYLPAFRAGQYFFTGRYDIATPSTQHGSVTLDQTALANQGIYRFEFTDLRDANAYRTKMAQTGEQRVLKTQLKYKDPVTGQYLNGKQKVVRDKNGNKLRDGVPRYYVVMQDRFMAMSDSIDELEAQLKDLRAGGKFRKLDDGVGELSQYRDYGASMMPLALGRMLKNIDDMSGVDPHTKAVSKQMITNSFIQTQQGNRLTKQLLRRQGTHGYETTTAAMYRSFNSHNEMMSRNVVSLDRIPEMRKAKDEIDKYIDALRDPTKRAAMPASEQARLTRDLAKHGDQAALRLGNYVAEVNHRIEGSMKPRRPGRGTALMTLLTSLTTMTYLASGAYYAIQALGWMQSFQRMSAAHGVGTAYRHLLASYHDVSAARLMGGGALEGWEELKHATSSTFRKTGLFRETADFVERVIANLTANGASNLALKIRAIRHARQLGHIGQAGLDQANLRLRNIEGGPLNKALKGMESATRIFRALQEGIETVNRAAPIAAYVDILKAEGKLSDDEIVRKAVTNMVNEQTSYAKGNWASWMSHPLAQFPLMFKKFAITQAITFYESLARVITPSSSPAERRAALMHVAMVTATLAAVGGLSGNPLWEPVRMGLYLMYLLGLMSPESWDETKTKGENMMASIVGQPTAEAVMYGLPRLVGIDVASKVASDNLLTFAQPEEFTQDDIFQLVGKIAAGAPGAVLLNGTTFSSEIVDTWQGDMSGTNRLINALPLPKVVKDIVKSYDQAVNGIKTKTGVDTGAALNIGEALASSMGFRTRTQVRPFEVGSVAKKKAEDRVKAERNALIRKVNVGRVADGVKAVKDWNAAHPDAKITVKTLVKAKKRLRQTEKDIREANEEAF